MGAFKLFCEFKFHNTSSMTCGHCGNNLIGQDDLVINHNHVYDIGILYKCSCQKSQVWTNSIRNEGNFIKFINGEIPYYYNGFCNDTFCGFCNNYVTPLENGYRYRGSGKYDRYGCQKCVQNQKVLVDGYVKNKEGDTLFLMDFYRARIDQLVKLGNTGN